MIDRDECEQYQDTLDRLFEGTASETDVRHLRGHADSCPDCAVLLEMHRHIQGTSLAELEAAVPNKLVSGMWPQVEKKITQEEWREAPRRGRSSVGRWNLVS